jgi:hypothetical protein
MTTQPPVCLVPGLVEVLGVPIGCGSGAPRGYFWRAEGSGARARDGSRSSCRWGSLAQQGEGEVGSGHGRRPLAPALCPASADRALLPLCAVWVSYLQTARGQ